VVSPRPGVSRPQAVLCGGGWPGVLAVGQHKHDHLRSADRLVLWGVVLVPTVLVRGYQGRVRVVDLGVSFWLLVCLLLALGFEVRSELGRSLDD
jgi:hypothetical protein